MQIASDSAKHISSTIYIWISVQETHARFNHHPLHADDFQLPYCGGTYFPNHTSVQAKEHRNVMQILPHIAHGLESKNADEDKFTQLAAR